MQGPARPVNLGFTVSTNAGELACLPLSCSVMQQVNWKGLTLICVNVCSAAYSHARPTVEIWRRKPS